MYFLFPVADCAVCVACSCILVLSHCDVMWVIVMPQGPIILVGNFDSMPTGATLSVMYSLLGQPHPMTFALPIYGDSTSVRYNAERFF